MAAQIYTDYSNTWMSHMSVIDSSYTLLQKYRDVTYGTPVIHRLQKYRDATYGSSAIHYYRNTGMLHVTVQLYTDYRNTDATYGSPVIH